MRAWVDAHNRKVRPGATDVPTPLGPVTEIAAALPEGDAPGVGSAVISGAYQLWNEPLHPFFREMPAWFVLRADELPKLGPLALTVGLLDSGWREDLATRRQRFELGLELGGVDRDAIPRLEQIALRVELPTRYSTCQSWS